MRNKLILIFSFFIFITNAQQKPFPRRNLTYEWITNFKEIKSKEEKIKSVISKVYTDTAYINIKKVIIADNKTNDSTKHICKTLILISVQNKFYEIDLLENPKMKGILEILSSKNIESVRILDYPENVLSFGSNGLCGVVVMQTDNKKLIKKLKTILRK